MAFRTDTPYKSDVFTVKQYGEHTVRISYSKCMRESGWEDDREHVKKGSVNDRKLDNNIARAKAKLREYALCNPWDYWCTFTVDEKKCERYDLDTYFKAFAKFINNYNRCEEPFRVKYLFVPEMHEDGAWHIHGFVKGIKPSDLYVNKYGYLTWKQYEKKFGFISMGRIKDHDRATSYILKYITKDTDKSVTALHKHIFYHSKGLQIATELYRGSGNYFGEWDWEHPDGYVKVKTLDVRTDNISDFLEVYG